MSSSKWFALKRNATLHHVVPISRSIVIDLKKLLGTSFRRHICIFRKGEQMSWNYDVSGIDTVARFMLRRTATANINEEIDRKWKMWARKLEAIFQQVERIKLSILSQKKLLKIYEDLIFNLEQESAYGTLSDFLSSELIPKTIAQYGRKLGVKGNLNEFISSATSSLYKSPYAQEQEELLKMAQQYKIGKDITAVLARHARTYWYLQNDYKVSRKLTPAFFRKQIVQFIKDGKDPQKEYDSLKEKIVHLIAKKRKLMQLAKARDQQPFLKILKMIDIHVKLWDLKKMMMQKAFYYLDEMLKEIGKGQVVPFEHIKWYTPDEIVALLAHNQKISNGELLKRKRLCVLEITKHSIIVHTDNYAKQTVQKIEGTIAIDMKDIRGQIGNKGHIKGRVRVILEPGQRSHFKQGEVLVTGMTTPDFLPIMRKAAAIVTEEGGITCHAAIVSRELNIPCVIGTKIATKVLKDGERVEVDAERGIVRKL